MSPALPLCRSTTTIRNRQTMTWIMVTRMIMKSIDPKWFRMSALLPNGRPTAEKNRAPKPLFSPNNSLTPAPYIGQATLRRIGASGLLPSVRRRLIHRVQQVLGLAVVVGIERPHESTAQIEHPIAVGDPEIGRNRVIISNVARLPIGSQHVGNKCNRIVKRLPSMLIDTILDERRVILRQDRVIAVSVRRGQRVRTHSE